MNKEDIFPNPDLVITYAGSAMMEEKGDMEYGVGKILLSRRVFLQRYFSGNNVETEKYSNFQEGNILLISDLW